MHLLPLLGCTSGDTFTFNLLKLKLQPSHPFLFTSSGQRIIKKSLGCLAGVAVPAAHAAPVLLYVRVKYVVTAHVLSNKTETTVVTCRISQQRQTHDQSCQNIVISGGASPLSIFLQIPSPCTTSVFVSFQHLPTAFQAVSLYNRVGV